jgi:hypothetical protein
MGLKAELRAARGEEWEERGERREERGESFVFFENTTK